MASRWKNGASCTSNGSGDGHHDGGSQLGSDAGDGGELLDVGLPKVLDGLEPLHQRAAAGRSDTRDVGDAATPVQGARDTSGLLEVLW